MQVDWMDFRRSRDTGCGIRGRVRLVTQACLETVLAMPAREEVRGMGPDGEEEVIKLPDYAVAAGAELTQLERRWLAELFAEEQIDAGEGDE